MTPPFHAVLTEWRAVCVHYTAPLSPPLPSPQSTAIFHRHARTHTARTHTQAHAHPAAPCLQFVTRYTPTCTSRVSRLQVCVAVWHQLQPAGGTGVQCAARPAAPRLLPAADVEHGRQRVHPVGAARLRLFLVSRCGAWPPTRRPHQGSRAASLSCEIYIYGHFEIAISEAPQDMNHHAIWSCVRSGAVCVRQLVTTTTTTEARRSSRPPKSPRLSL